MNVIDTNTYLSQCSKNKTNMTLGNVGNVIKDRVPKEEIKLIKFPLKQSHMSVNLSDRAFEEVGDMIADNIDTGHAEISTGENCHLVN